MEGNQVQCDGCKENKSPGYYCPQELMKFQLLFCKKCLELLKYQDLRYMQNKEEVLKLIKNKKNNRI